MPATVSIASPGYFFAERHPGFTFSRIVWHAAGHEETVRDFINGYYEASDLARSMNLRLAVGRVK